MVGTRSVLFCLLSLTIFIQACNEDDKAASGKAVTLEARQAKVTVPENTPAMSAQHKLPPRHPAMDTQGALPASPLEAMRILKIRLDRNPKDVDSLISFGNAHMMIERFADAAKLYERALAINPKDLDVRANLATAYKYTDKTDQAIAELKKNLAADPRHGASLYNLGFIYYFDKKDMQSALPLWKQWLVQYPNIPEADEIRGYVAQIEGTPAQPAVERKAPQKGA